MRTVIFGKNIKNIYEADNKLKTIIDANGKEKLIFTEKPSLEKKIETTYVELLRYKGIPRYNKRTGIFSFNFKDISMSTLNISETETVQVSEEIFRADLNEMHLHTLKIVNETEVNKEEAELELLNYIKQFNKAMIESNDKLKTYCDVHKLSYEDTDCIELFKLVFPNKKYTFNDGRMEVRKDTITLTTNAGTYPWDTALTTATAIKWRG